MPERGEGGAPIDICTHTNVCKGTWVSCQSRHVLSMGLKLSCYANSAPPKMCLFPLVRQSKCRVEWL